MSGATAPKTTNQLINNPHLRPAQTQAADQALIQILMQIQQLMQ